MCSYLWQTDPRVWAHTAVIDLTVSSQAVNTQLSVTNTQQPKGKSLENKWVNSAISTNPKHLETGLLLNYSWVCPWAGYRFGSPWKWVFLSKLQNACFSITAEREGGKNIFIILGLYSLARRKWGNTETDTWEMKTVFAPPNFKLQLLWLWERLMLA